MIVRSLHPKRGGYERKSGSAGAGHPEKDILILEDRYFKPANVCIVTGAASGIGRATTLAMAANGVKVLCADVDETGGEATVKMAERLGGQAQFFKVDLTSEEQIKACVAQAAKLGAVKFLANIAGIGGSAHCPGYRAITGARAVSLFASYTRT